ncbi:hypothetical protein CAAN3_08S02960 [[Candida] anglica]
MPVYTISQILKWKHSSPLHSHEIDNLWDDLLIMRTICSKAGHKDTTFYQHVKNKRLNRSNWGNAARGNSVKPLQQVSSNTTFRKQTKYTDSIHNGQYSSSTSIPLPLPPPHQLQIPLIPLFSLLNVPSGSQVLCIRPGSPAPPGAIIIPVVYMDNANENYNHVNYHDNWVIPSESNLTNYEKYHTSNNGESINGTNSFDESSDSNSILIQIPSTF